ncbi:MAG: FHA domain-containing protein [Planctomycetota bacterium]
MELARMAATTRGNVADFLIRPDEAVTLGRSSACTVPLRDPKVSRRHCQLSFAQGRVIAVDLASSHGLLHRGARQPMVALAIGDGFHLGETFVRFVAVERVDDATAAAWFAPGGSHERRSIDADDDGAADDGEQTAAPPVAPPAPTVAAASTAPAAAPSVFADEVPPAAAPAVARGRGWEAFAPTPGPGASAATGARDGHDNDVIRLPPSARRAGGGPGPSAATSFAARLAAEAVVSAMHLALVVVLLLLLKKAFGFDLYRAFGMGG